MSRALKQLLIIQTCFCGLSAVVPYFARNFPHSEYSLAMVVAPVVFCGAYVLGFPFARQALLAFTLTTVVLGLLVVGSMAWAGPDVFGTLVGALLTGQMVLAILLYLAVKHGDDPQTHER